ncbi:sensor domain-containing protein [Mycobacterium decipiens]|uniref:PknH-like extracellular domain-containing protein n=1 Tax=Mycobacterium decipiens TaxID=1430326 RepID=A0A1X2LUJ9_9MYCO|nr:sensor domain-containing protein [Mycobacterium decipiens]OSC40639.1 hypothetical protein B8W66_12205 [Mycobacterium decipiens]
MHRATRWPTTLLATAWVVGGCASTVAGNPQAGADRGPLSWGPDLTEAQLAGVLLDEPQINQIMGSDAMTVINRYDRTPDDAGGTYSDPTCAGAVFNTVETAYQGSRYVATRGSEWSEPGAHFTHYVDQGVVSFHSGQDARKFLSASQDVWRRCVAKHVTYTPKDGKPSTWTIRAPATRGGVTATVVDKEAGGGYTCSHGITAKSNVVIDVSACSYRVADQGVATVSSVVNAIAGKFPT